MTGSIGILIAALVVCVALSAFFSASETAFSAVNRLRLKTMANEGNRKAKTALYLADHYDRLITTILIGNNVVNIAATAIATVLFTGLAGDMGATLSTVVMTLVVLVFGEISPKTLAKQSPERIALGVAGPLSVVMTILRPLDAVFSLLRMALAAMFKPAELESNIEEDLMTMVDEAESEGDMDAHEGDLIRSAIEFNDQDAVSILTPRVDMTAIEDTATIEEAESLFLESGYSRLPVIHEDMDHVVGILHEKDFYMQKHAGITDIRHMMQPAVWAPSTLKISKLLKMFQSSQTHMVILLDEFGGTEGLVTMEDVLEELVGEIYDEHDDVNEDIVEQKDGSMLVDGSMQLSDLMEELGKKDVFESDTVGGWAAEMMERIPQEGDSFLWEGLRCTVDEMEKRRVVQLLITPEEAEETPED